MRPRALRAAAEMFYDRKVACTRAKIRKMITKQLRAAPDKENATMHWKMYWTNVVEWHSVIIEGWPAVFVPFSNLNSGTSSLPQLEMLWLRWKTGLVRFRLLGDDERAALVAAGFFAHEALLL
ncbi:hypothetical protein TRAPUB_10260 [Trametes pubescens]|uniref:Uncharacterized protein n=1 Tax=Trametes pubescens TaxID=154538 RepID=A0A1M2VZX4_TRAPU|nr:hypothetical protein TRAPUB_10260 [Trametes pubescens]